MGRCNNRRVQQAAAASRNVPSRARFSKPPPSSKKKAGRGGRGGRSGCTQASSAVIDKISKRVSDKTRQASSSTNNTRPSGGSTKTRGPLDGVDIQKLDEIKLSDESIEIVTKILRELNVMESPTQTNTVDEKDDDDDGEVDSNCDHDDNDDSVFDELQQQFARASGGGYSEYEEDIEENFLDGPARSIDVENNDDIDEATHDENDNDEHIIQTPLFLHLTTQLSFLDEHAKRACRAIENWQVPIAKNDSGSKLSSDMLDSDDLALAMDWLCLHLTDAELKAGFRPNSKSMEKQFFSRGSRGMILAGTGRTRPIPHSSISVAKPITSDQEWRDTLRRQSRKVGFLRLGFHHMEAEKAIDGTMHVSEKINPEEDEEALRIMLSTVEKDVAPDTSIDDQDSCNATDLEYAKSEREQEIQALEAIFDDQFQIRRRDDKGFDRYQVSVTPVEDLEKPGHSDECVLHVFVRPCYPVLCPPLLLFTNTTLPPSLLRRVNESLIQQAHKSIGEPSLFAIIDFLANSLHVMQIDFIKEQRRKEMEAEQLLMRREAGHDVDAVIDAQHAKNGKLGRRQHAKLRAAERAFDHDEHLERKEEERRQRQKVRLERIKGEQNSIRLTMAERVVGQRAKQRVEEEAERTSRAAMTAAFHRGESVEQARRAAQKARNESLRHNGEDVDSSEDEDKADNEKEESLAESIDLDSEYTSENDAPSRATSRNDQAAAETHEAKRATPATLVFMERLRQCYYDAASKKSRSEKPEDSVLGKHAGNDGMHGYEGLREPTYHFAKPAQQHIRDPFFEKDEGRNIKVHVPMPVPVPSAELRDAMKEIIKTQDEQPWLISLEARVPTVKSDETELTPEQRQERDEISTKLRLELIRKHKAADAWARNSSNRQTTSGKNLSKPQQFHSMRAARERLPAYMMKLDIVEMIATNQVTVISGATGCGKTTTVPQLVLDDMIMKGHGAEANMIVTQPRRISALGVSERIAAERCERNGETVGYCIRLESKRSAKTRLLLCTTGILLRRLQCDPDLASVSHVFVDEVHERDLNTDFLLIVLKDLLVRRKYLKLVLMSATLNANAFSDYFAGCPVVSIPGRAYPVQENRLEDVLQLTGYVVQEGSDYAAKTSASRPARLSKSALQKKYDPKYTSSVINSLAIVDETIINFELIACLVENIAVSNAEGAILVFLPGMMEITKAIEEIYKREFFQSSKAKVYPLHSSLSTKEQTSVFEVPPAGIRKIVVATNIAETSITIEDVVYVVDAGRVKENRKDEVKEMPTLVETWVSRASAKQRRGRAGRVREGISYHLFSSHTYEHDMQDYQLPEMLRVGLEDLVLKILLLDLGEPCSFLAKAINPPSALAMRNSLKLLEGLGAVEVEWHSDDSVLGSARTNASKKSATEQESSTCGALSAESGLTALGYHLATIPTDPRIGKMVIYGALFQCTDACLTIAASMSVRSPFLSPFDKRDEADAARKGFAMEGSDHLTTLNAFNTWKEVRRIKGAKATQSFLRENFLSRPTLEKMEHLRQQFADLLIDMGFLPKGFRFKGSKGRSSGLQEAQSQADAYSGNTSLVKAMICAGLYPNIIVAPRNLCQGVGGKEVGECAFQSLKGDVYVHPCTVSFSEKRLTSRYCCYYDMVRTSKTFVRDCTTVSEFALLLFGGSLKVYHAHGAVTIDDWLKFRISPKAAALVKHLRAQVECMLLKKIVSPEEDITGSVEAKGLIQAVSAIVSQEIITLPDGADIIRPWTVAPDGYSRSPRWRNSGGGRVSS